MLIWMYDGVVWAKRNREFVNFSCFFIWQPNCNVLGWLARFWSHIVGFFFDSLSIEGVQWAPFAFHMCLPLQYTLCFSLVWWTSTSTSFTASHVLRSWRSARLWRESHTRPATKCWTVRIWWLVDVNSFRCRFSHSTSAGNLMLCTYIWMLMMDIVDEEI